MSDSALIWKVAAQKAALSIQKHLEIKQHLPTALVLGTGWGDALELRKQQSIPFTKIPGFEDLGQLEGHAREVVVGYMECGRPVIALRGRVHLNEAPADPVIYRMVRLQVEMLFQLGVKTLITTCAAGSLGGAGAYDVGTVTAITAFVTLFSPDMPLYAGEFCNPEDTLDTELAKIASREIAEVGLYPELGSRTFVAPGYENNADGYKQWQAAHSDEGAYAMVRGPFFEGRKLDKKVLLACGANLVGMSTLPEACIAALYGAKMIALAFVTNNDKETHEHQTNVARVKAASPKLGQLLGRIVKRLPEPAST